MKSRETIVTDYERDGYYVCRQVVDPLLIEEARVHVEWLAKKYPQLRPEHYHHPLMREDAFWVRLVTDDALLDITEMILGANLACFTAHYICKPAYDGQAVLWHQDGAYWNLYPMDALTLWLAIDESRPENGCLRVIPGSHRLPLLEIEPKEDEPNLLYSCVKGCLIDIEKAVDIVLEPGDVSIHHPRVVHGSERNGSARRRCGLDIGYIRTSTAIRNEGLYLDPILVRGNAVAGVNRYGRWPEYESRSSIEFAGWREWNEKVRGLNAKMTFDVVPGGSPLDGALKMIERLKAGTTRRSQG